MPASQTHDVDVVDKPQAQADAQPGTDATTAASADTAAAGPQKLRVRWYRCKIPRDQLAELNRRSDLLGFAQTAGFLALLTASAGLAVYSWSHWPWYLTALLIFVNGHFWHFLLNGFHELIHDSVFKTRWLNRFFLRIYSFLGWHSHHFFWASHTEHHKYTLHPPEDLEVVLPQTVRPENLLKFGIVNIRYPYDIVRDHLKTAMGRIDPDNQWANHLFPESDPKGRRQLFNWARIMLIGHGAILAVSLAMGWWAVPFVITFPCMFGGWLHTLCNSAQHIGLSDKVPDYRLCCRTMYLNPFLQFLYWHMNYHTEHHMYAAVPCYKLGRLHRAIKHEMPACPNGLRETWQQIFAIQKRQQQDPDYQFVPDLPENAPARTSG